MKYPIAKTTASNGSIISTSNVIDRSPVLGEYTLKEWWETTINGAVRTICTDKETARMSHFEAVRHEEEK